jgi:hypothetical protein
MQVTVSTGSGCTFQEIFPTNATIDTVCAFLASQTKVPSPHIRIAGCSLFYSGTLPICAIPTDHPLFAQSLITE